MNYAKTGEPGHESLGKKFRIERGSIVNEKGQRACEYWHDAKVVRGPGGDIVLGRLGSMWYPLKYEGGKFVGAYFKGGFGDNVKHAEEDLERARSRSRKNADDTENLRYYKHRLAEAQRNPATRCHEIEVSGRVMKGQTGSGSGIITSDCSSLVLPADVTVS